MSFCEVRLMTRQIKKLLDFYNKYLGVMFVAETEGKYVYEVGEVKLVVVEGLEANNNNTNIGLAFETDDIEREYEKLTARHIHIIEKPHDNPDGHRSFCFYDIDGNHIFLRQR